MKGHALSERWRSLRDVKDLRLHRIDIAAREGYRHVLLTYRKQTEHEVRNENPRRTHTFDWGVHSMCTAALGGTATLVHNEKMIVPDGGSERSG